MQRIEEMNNAVMGSWDTVEKRGRWETKGFVWLE